MANNFRNINYPVMLLEALRNFFSINASGNVSTIYKYLSCFVQPFQLPFTNFEAFRNKEMLIANCKWQIGQLTNVLNMLYDASLKRIYITQSVVTVISDPMFQYAPVNFDSDFGTDPEIYEVEFDSRLNETLVTINIPTAVATASLTDMIATIEQIRILGIPYQILTF